MADEPNSGPPARVPEVVPAGTADAGAPTTRLGRVRAWSGVLVGAAYILNPGCGWVELLPDSIPGVGNLDEAAAAGLVFYGLQYLARWRRERRARPR